MRTIILAFVLPILLVFNLQAQKVTGVVKNTKGAVVAGATVSLHHAADSSIIKLQVSKEDGSFSFAVTDSAHYLVSASFVGYVTTYSPVEGRPSQPLTILLPDAPAEMKAVVVTASKPLLQVKGDRTIVNVEGTVNAAGNNVLELLRKSPTVTVGSDERIGMNGKSGVQVFIDGKPTPLAGTDLATYLKSLQASEVEAIELIHHPSAKYEAAGNAGIINIRLKKNKALGTNGSVTLGYNRGINSSHYNSLSLNHRTTRLNLFGTLGYNSTALQKDMRMNRQLADSIFDQQGTLKETSKALNLKGGIDYFINQQNTIGVLVNGNFGTTGFTNDSYTTIGAKGAEPSRILKADNRFSSNRDHLDLNLNYLYNGKEGKSLTLNADYGYYNMKGAQLQPNTYFDSTGRKVLNNITYEMITPTAIDIYSVKADYEQPVLGGKLGAGFKSSYVKTDNDFQHYNMGQNSKDLDYNRSNRFLYRENIHTAYLNFSRTWNDLQLQAGLRAENTGMNGSSTGKKEVNGLYQPYDSTIRQAYLDLFPSVAVTCQVNDHHQWRISLSRRVDRPAYQDLNPFELKVDDYIAQRGNAYLRPQYTTSIGAGYVYRQKLSTSLDYSTVKDVAAWIVDTTETSKSVVAKQNIASQKLVALTISYPFQYKNYTVFTNLNGTYTTYAGEFGKGRTINEKGWGMNLYMQHSLKFAKTWTAEVSGFYYSPSLQEGNMRADAFWALDAGVQTKLAEDKVTLKLSVSDVFNSLRFHSQSSFAGQQVAYHTKNETRQVKLSVGFRLGSKDVKTTRQRKSGAEDEMKRVNQ